MTARLNCGDLYVVATPIGHLGDLTRRAEDVLKAVQIVAAEDTRRTRVLLDHINHRTPELVSLHEHNEAAMGERLVERLRDGSDVALVSDAGTPLVNDPGYALVQAAHAAGIRVIPVPGASAITAALSVCPLPARPFRYVGFLPQKAKARRFALKNWLMNGDALIFLEAPHRVLASLKDIGELCERRVMLGRELTKQFEEVLVGTAAEVAAALGEEPRGEFTGIVEAAEVADVSFDHRQVLSALLEELKPAQAARIAATICGTPKSVMYDLAIRLGETN